MNPPLPRGTPPAVDDAGAVQAGPPAWRCAFVVGARAALVMLIAIVWELAARRNWVDPFFVSMPSAIVLQLFHWLREGTPLGPLLVQLRVTVGEALLGLAIGTIAGAACAIVVARNRLLAEVLGFYVKIANAVPLIGLAAIFAIALGLGIASKVALAAVMAFFVSSGSAFERVPAPARVSAVTQAVFASLRTGFALSLAGALVSEFLGARQGIGRLIAFSQAEFDATGVLAALIAIGAAALIVDGLLAAIQARWLNRPQRT